MNFLIHVQRNVRYIITALSSVVVAFLKKTHVPNITLSQLRIGSKVLILSRQLEIKGYGDNPTSDYFASSAMETTLAIIKPDAYNSIGLILHIIHSSSLIVSNIIMVKLSKQDASEFYIEHRGKPFFETLIEFMSSDVIVAISVTGENAITHWRDMIGPTNSTNAKTSYPTSIRAKFGTDGTKNAVHGSDSVLSAQREIDFFFSSRNFPTTAILNNCCLLMIKPHAVQDSLGKIISMLHAFEISALELVTLDLKTAEEFFEVYKGVLPEFVDMCKEITTGPVIVMEIRQENVVEKLRELVGPVDPVLAKHIRPNTIRALFGSNRVHNAVHCTDLAEDGIIECEFFFKYLKN